MSHLSRTRRLGLGRRVIHRPSLAHEPPLSRHPPETSVPWIVSCPRCQSGCVVPSRRAQVIAVAIGGLAGAIQGIAIALAETEKEGAETDPLHPLGVLAGAILGGLLGSAAGGAAGAAVGISIDQTLPGRCRCQTCGHVFALARPDTVRTGPPRML
jgi:hypothetical protein